MYKSDLKRHLESVHEGIKPFKCNICGKGSASNGEMKKHVETVHEGKKPFKCTTCNSCYTRKTTLNKHIKSVHESMNQFYPEVSLDDEDEDDSMISIDEIKNEETLDESCLDEKEPPVYQSEMNS